MGSVPVVRVAGRSARVVVSATLAPSDDEDPLRIQGGSFVRRADGSFDVTAADSRLVVHCPTGSCITVSTASGTVLVRGAAGSVRVMTASGRVEVDEADDVDVRSASGRVEVGWCRDTCRVSTKSGRIEVGVAGVAELASVSGRVTVARADRVRARTVSSRIALGANARGQVDAHSMSGRVDVTVAGDGPVHTALVSVSGRVACHVPEGDGGSHVEVKTVSGSITVERP